MKERLLTYIQEDPRRALRVLMGGLLSLAFFLWVSTQIFHHLTTGTIVIKTNGGNNAISLGSVGSGTYLAQSQGGLRATLSPGQYAVTVSNRLSSSSKKIVTIRARATVTYTINLQSVINPQPVLPFGASSLLASGSQLLYVDMTTHLLYAINGANPPVPVNQNVTFASITWQNPQYGIGLGYDNNSLYTIRNGTVNSITIPFAPQSLVYDVAPNGRLAVSDGKAVYLQAADGSFNKIFTSSDRNDRITSIGASNSKIFVRFAADTGGDGNDADAVVINYIGATIAKANNLAAYTYKWSPDGQDLAVTSDSTTIIYSQKLKPLVTLPDGNVLGMTWLNNSVLLYGAGANLFSYNVSSRDTVHLSTIAGNDGAVSGIYPSQDGSQIYMLAEVTTIDSSGDPRQSYEVERTDMTGSVPDYIGELAVFLPVQLPACYVSYVNFVHPVIIVTPSDPSSALSCVQAAQDSLANDQIDPSQLTFYTNTT